MVDFQLLQLLLTGLLGLCLGSFLNVVILRLRAGQRLSGRSRCPRCRHRLSAAELIPLFSYLWLRGRCFRCRRRISLQYPLVEATCSAILVVLLLHFGLSWRFVAAGINALFLVVLFVYDLRFRQVPDELSLPAAGVALAGNLLLGASFTWLLLGGILGAGFFALQYTVSRGQWVGDGDVRLGLLMGFSLGLSRTVLALVLAYAAGALAALLLIATKRARLSSTMPFGTLLTAAIFVSLLWGQPLIHWYLSGQAVRDVGLNDLTGWIADRFFRL